VSRLSHTLARGVEARRTTSSHRRSREAVLSSLLAKRAAAHRAGLHQLEKQLRSQILWGLPMIRVMDEPRVQDNESDVCPPGL
jgi:hypothetical protein